MAVSIISGVILKMCAGIKNPRWTSSRLRILCRALAGNRQSHTENNIKLISNLQLTTDVFPSRVFQGEEFKFTARLTSDGKPLLLRDF